MEIILTEKMKKLKERNEKIVKDFKSLLSMNNVSRTRIATTLSVEYGITMQRVIDILKKEEVW